MELTDEAWRTLSRLIDEVLDLPETERSSWLARIDSDRVSLKPLLEQLLADPAIAQTGDFLATLPKVVAPLETCDTSASGLAPGSTVGPYRLIREIGRGGMASVWLAERVDGLVKRPVALKLPHVAAHPALLADRFAREREILAGLTHTNIARLYDVGVALGRPYLAMEYVAGVPITAYCDEKTLSLRERVDLFLQVLTAVQYAHSRLVIHRDLKPSNMLVTPTGEARLLDFGIAKLLTDGGAGETQLTEVGGRALTLRYASPEQIAGDSIGTATDVYSLGIVLYELLAGTQPYRVKRDSPAALEDAILTAEPVWPSQASRDIAASATARATTPAKLARSLAGDLDNIVLKALRKPANERYATVEAFAQDLRRYLNAEPIAARAHSTWYRVRKFVRRNRLAAASATAIVAAIAVGLGLAIWQAHVARVEARTAEAVQTFLEDVFRTNSTAQRDPQKARQMTARELLDVGAGKIDVALNDVPAAKLNVLATLSALYQDLNDYDDAARLRRSRVDLARSLYGEPDPRVADALIDLAKSLSMTKNKQAVEPILTEAATILDGNRDYTSGSRALLLQQFGNLYSGRDQIKSLEYLHKAVALRRAMRPSADFVQALTQEGAANMWLSRYVEAEASLQEALAVADKVGPDAKPSLPSLYRVLAQVEDAQQEIAAAEASYRRAAATAVEFYGPDDISALVAKYQLGFLLFRTSRTKEGIETMAQVIEHLASQGRLNDPVYAPFMLRGYARSLQELGRIEDAYGYTVKAAETDRQYSAGQEPLARSLDLQASIATVLGRYAEAHVLLDEAGSIHDAIHAARDSQIPHAIAVAQWLLATAQPDEAMRALERVSPEQPAGNKLPFTWLAVALTGAQADLANNAPHAADTATGVLSRIEQSPLRPFFGASEARAAFVAGAALLKAGRPADASPLLERAIALYRALYDEGRSPELADARVALAACLVDTGKADQAHAQLAQAKAIYATHTQLGEQYTKALHALEVRLIAAAAHTAAHTAALH